MIGYAGRIFSGGKIMQEKEVRKQYEPFRLSISFFSAEDAVRTSGITETGTKWKSENDKWTNLGDPFIED